MLGLLRSRVVLSLASPTTASALRPVVVAPRRLMSSEAGDTEAAGQMDEASASSPPAGRSFVGVNRVTLAGYVQDAPAYIDTKNGGKVFAMTDGHPPSPRVSLILPSTFVHTDALVLARHVRRAPQSRWRDVCPP